jgi:polyisoprenoid-binding protein YceI
MSIDTTQVRDFGGLTIPAPGTFTLDPAHTRVGFVVRHLMINKVRGGFGDVAGDVVVAEDPLESSVHATIQAASIDTGVADRDNHLRSADFLDAASHPTLEFRSTGLRSRSANEFVLDGELTVRGITRPVTLRLEFEGAARSPWGQEVVGFTATTEIDREEFGLTWNQALETGGVLVGKQIKIEIEAEAVRQA